MLVGHSTGFNFVIEVDGWDGKTYTPPDNEGEKVGILDIPHPFVEYLGVEAEMDSKPGLYIRPGDYPPVVLSGDAEVSVGRCGNPDDMMKTKGVDNRD